MTANELTLFRREVEKMKAAGILQMPAVKPNRQVKPSKPKPHNTEYYRQARLRRALMSDEAFEAELQTIAYPAIRAKLRISRRHDRPLVTAPLPLCECGCQQSVGLNSTTFRPNRYVTGHQQRYNGRR